MDDFFIDYLFVEFFIKLKFCRVKFVKCWVFDYKNGDFEGFCFIFFYILFNLCVIDDINDYWLVWKDLFFVVVKEYIFIKIIMDKNIFFWIDKDVCYLIYKKYIILKKYC